MLKTSGSSLQRGGESQIQDQSGDAAAGGVDASET